MHAYQGGGGVKKPQKYAYIICERPLMNALVYPDIDQGIHKGKKSKIAQNEKNIENIEHLIF